MSTLSINNEKSFFYESRIRHRILFLLFVAVSRTVLEVCANYRQRRARQRRQVSAITSIQWTILIPTDLIKPLINQLVTCRITVEARRNVLVVPRVSTSLRRKWELDEYVILFWSTANDHDRSFSYFSPFIRAVSTVKHAVENWILPPYRNTKEKSTASLATPSNSVLMVWSVVWRCPPRKHRRNPAHRVVPRLAATLMPRWLPMSKHGTGLIQLKIFCEKIMEIDQRMISHRSFHDAPIQSREDSLHRAAERTDRVPSVIRHFDDPPVRFDLTRVPLRIVNRRFIRPIPIDVH